MLKNTLLTFYRVTVRHPLYAALNLLGLSFGIAVFVTLSLYAHFETSFESWIPNADKIYEVGTLWTLTGRPDLQTENSMGGLIDQLHEDYPDLVATRDWDMDATVHLGSDVVHEKEHLVDPDFFKLFDLPLAAGSKADALAPGRILLTESMARKYFGRSDAVGETLQMFDDEGPRSYVVSAVLKDLPRNTDFKLDFVRLLTPESHRLMNDYWAHWGSSSLNTYARFETPAEADRFEAGLEAFVDRKAGEVRPGMPYHTIETLHLLKLRGLHLRDKQSGTAVVTLALVGLLSFFIAAINFINLSTARAGMRAREVAVRRTLGATRSVLRVQFLGEALLMTLAASVAGLSIVELCLPLINAAGGLDLNLDYRHQGGFLLLLMGGVLLLGLMSGIYPAFVLSSFQPSQVLASSRSPSGGRFGMRLREVLVIVQFAVVIAFFVLTWGFERQIDHMKTADLGFHRSALMIVPADDSGMTPASKLAVRAAFQQIPGVTLVGMGNSAPGDENVNGGNVKLPGDTGAETNLTVSQVGADYFTAYGSKLLAGRFLDEAHGDETLPDETAASNIVVSRKAMALLGLRTPEEAIGKTAYSGKRPLQIVGVTEDMQFRSPKGEILPMYYYFHRELKSNLIFAVRYEGVAEPEMRRRLTDAWRLAAPDVPPTLLSADETLDKYYKPDRNRSNLFGAGALIAALVGCIGLYGMAAFTASRRMLEVAVRKVLGASRGKLVTLLVGSFLRPVLIANLIAVPVAYLVLRNWLIQFNDHIDVTAVPFLVGGGGAILVAGGTVAWLAWTAANSAPGRALRSE